MLWSDSMAWLSNLEVLLLIFLIYCLQHNNKKLAAISNSLLLGKISNLWRLGLEEQALCEGSRPVVCPIKKLFFLFDYFRKYFYLSSFKTTTFLLLLKYLFWSVLCTLLQVVFSSVTKLLLYLITIFEYFCTTVWEHTVYAFFHFRMN